MSDPFIGEIRMFAGNYAPESWALCDGSLLSIAAHDALFSLIGTTYGGDGQSNFALPDLRGRLPMGQGTGPSLTPRTMGEHFGTETVTLTERELPAHNHVFTATTTAATGANPDGNLFADTGNDTLYVPDPPSPDLKTMNAKTVANAGTSQPHDNIMPSVAMNYIICLNGIYPSRN
ncbi:MAG: tail fiber protein [Cellvibrionaceae bacterium]